MLQWSQPGFSITTCNCEAGINKSLHALIFKWQYVHQSLVDMYNTMVICTCIAIAVHTYMENILILVNTAVYKYLHS